MPVTLMRAAVAVMRMARVIAVRAAVMNADVMSAVRVSADSMTGAQLVADVPTATMTALAVVHSSGVAHAQKRHAGDAGKTQKHAEIVNVHGVRISRARNFFTLIVTEKMRLSVMQDECKKSALRSRITTKLTRRRSTATR